MRRTSRLIISGVCSALALTLSGCGGSPDPDREQAKDVVVGFFRDIAEGDVEGICEKLAGTGRAQAIGSPTVAGRPPPQATEEQCIRDGAHVALSSVDLPSAVRSGELRVIAVEIAGKRARVIVAYAALTGVQRLSKTDEGWKIDLFDTVVRN